LEFLPPEVREGLEAARKRERRKQSKLHVSVGDTVFPVLRFLQVGFALDGVHGEPSHGNPSARDRPHRAIRYARPYRGLGADQAGCPIVMHNQGGMPRGGSDFEWQINGTLGEIYA